MLFQDPVVNFDEAGKQLVEHIKAPKNMSPGQCHKVDYEYKRSGVANIFMLVDEAKETINWMFNVDAARSKLNKAYGKVRESTD